MKMDAIDIERGAEAAQIPSVIIQRLLELLELAARRGAFELEEYHSVGTVFLQAKECLQ